MSSSSGPWYISRLGRGPIVCAEGATPTNEPVTCLDIVARVDWGRGKEDEANALLIAAAPEMLSVLKDLAEVWLSDEDPDWEPRRLVDAVIAKAEPR